LGKRKRKGKGRERGKERIICTNEYLLIPSLNKYFWSSCHNTIILRKVALDFLLKDEMKISL
jgi:hypothetical protein